MNIFLATRNRDKISEIRNIFADFPVEFLTFEMFPELSGCDAPETGVTLHENALQKAVFWQGLTSLPVISDDTGLFVNALSGSPGVYSSRYAGPDASYDDNVRLLLREMKGKENRKACFETVAVFIDLDGAVVTGKGRLHGEITSNSAGDHGFGYDPVFLVQGLDRTLAEIPEEEKNRISHRYLAMVDLRSRLIDQGILS